MTTRLTPDISLEEKLEQVRSEDVKRAMEHSRYKNKARSKRTRNGYGKS